jgi:hypothetical protein
MHAETQISVFNRSDQVRITTELEQACRTRHLLLLEDASYEHLLCNVTVILFIFNKTGLLVAVFTFKLASCVR